MTHFATIGVDHIQSHLSRSRHLWGRRGASALMVELTSLPTDASAGPSIKGRTLRRVLDAEPGVSVAGDALDVDGLVTLQAEDAAAVRRAARALATAITDALPGATATVRTLESSGFTESLVKDPGGRYKHATAEERFAPVPHEYPPARLCEECATSPASRVVETHPGEVQSLCTDCISRHGASSRWDDGSLTRSTFSAELRLRQHLRSTRPEIRTVSTFDELADLRAHEDRQQRAHEDNHLALVFADGNAMGHLFDEATARAIATGSTGELRALSDHVKKATEAALWRATEAILLPDDDFVPVIPHLLGGDDLLVSVTADRAWPFVDAFLTDAQRRYGEVSRDLSISAGVVLARSSFPFGDQVELAERVLKGAKRAGLGRKCTVAWVDVTETGPHLPRGRRPWTLDDLHARKPALDHTLETGNTALGAIRVALETDREWASLNLWHQALRDRQVRDLLTALGFDPTVPLDDPALGVLSETLSLSRWWRRVDV